HPLGAPWPPRSMRGKMLIAISESRRPRPNSVRYPVNAGLLHQAARAEQRRSLFEPMSSAKFKEIFGEKSRYVVCILDKHHSDKIWPTFEREIFTHPSN